jgi:hypothetical protein
MIVFSGVFCLVKLCNYGIRGNFLRLAYGTAQTPVYDQGITVEVQNGVKHLLWISELLTSGRTWLPKYVLKYSPELND